MGKLADFVRRRSTTGDADNARLEYRIQQQNLQIVALRERVHRLERLLGRQK